MQGASVTRFKTGAETLASTRAGHHRFFGLCARPRWRGRNACSGMTVLEVLLVTGLLGIMLTLSVGWVGSFSKRRLQNAAYLVEGDLRLAQQAAIASAGTGPQAEFCLRSNGYDVYTVVYQNPAGRTSPVVGTTIKIANAGQEYPFDVTMTPDPAAAVACTIDASREAIVFLGNGAPEFPDSNSHRITLALGGHSLSISIQPTTGTASVGQ